jgi:hypothetical protein
MLKKDLEFADIGYVLSFWRNSYGWILEIDFWLNNPEVGKIIP